MLKLSSFSQSLKCHIVRHDSSKFLEVELCFGILFSHSKAVQPKLNRALAGKANLPEYLWNRPQAPQAFLVLIQISEGAALHPVIYGAFLHHKFRSV